MGPHKVVARNRLHAEGQLKSCLHTYKAKLQPAPLPGKKQQAGSLKYDRAEGAAHERTGLSHGRESGCVWAETRTHFLPAV